MSSTITIALDTNIVIALLNADDSTHLRAMQAYHAIKPLDAQQVIFDVVMIEALSVIARRLEEKKRASEFNQYISKLEAFAPKDEMEWLSLRIPTLYDECLALMHETSGRLNFNDALIALGCRELGITHLMSFDTDFDYVQWLTRVA